MEEKRNLNERLWEYGASVPAGSVVAVIAPGENQFRASLHALCLAGTEEDLPDVERWARGAPGYSELARHQAAASAEATHRRPKAGR
jgi:hypothetical protein